MSTDIATIQAAPTSSHAIYQKSADLFSDPASFEHYQRVAKLFSCSNLVPKHFQGNTADCLIALQISRRLDEDPLTVFQSIYLINGKPGWSSAYLIARANRAKVFQSTITWDEEGKGDDLTVTAKAVLADTGEEVRVTCDMRMAKAEQWTRNSKYQTMPSHMLKWRSAAMLIRLYCPQILFGMPVVEELETVQQHEVRDVTSAKTAARTLDDFAGSIEHVIGNGTEEIKESEVMQHNNVAIPTHGTDNSTPRQPETSVAVDGGVGWRHQDF